MDEKTTHTPDRWCPECGHWVPDEQQRVRADGLRRHSACDTVTTPTKTTPGEHLALPTNGDGKQARKCTCGVGEDHFAAAAELKSFAKGGPVTLRGEAGPELLFPHRPPRVHHDANCVELLLGGRCNCSATGVVGTAVEDIPANGEGTVQLGDSASAWERAAVTPEPLFPCICCHGVYPLVGGTLVAHDVPERCPGSGTVPVMFAEVATLKEPRLPTVGPFAAKPVPWDHPDADPAGDLAAFVQAAKDAGAAPRMPLPVVGPFVAKHLVARGAVEGRDYVVQDPTTTAEQIELLRRMAADERANGNLDAAVPLEAKAEELGHPELIVTQHPMLKDPARERVSTVDWSVLAPELVAAAQARQHVWIAGSGLLRNCFCHRGIDHTEQPLTDLQIAAMEMSAAMNQLDAVGQLGGVSSDQERNRALAEQLVDDLADCSTFQERLTPTGAAEVAMWIVACGWVPGARRRAVDLPRATAEMAPPLQHRFGAIKESVLGVKGEVIGYVWQVPTKPDQWYGESIHRADTDTPRFMSQGPGKLPPRDQAIGWVLEQDHQAGGTQ